MKNHYVLFSLPPGTFQILLVTFLFSVILFCVQPVFAQKNITTSGGDAAGANGTVSYSIGQIDCQTNSGSNGTVTEGVQQPYEIFEVSIKDYEGVAFNCLIYPNPTNDVLHLRIADYEQHDFSGFHFSVCDLTGKLLMQHEIFEENTEISMGNLPKGTYMVNVLADHKAAKTFKIIKN